MAARSNSPPKAALCALTLLAFVPLPASAGPVIDAPSTAGTPTCGPYARLHAMLVHRLGEQPASAGLSDDGTILQVFASTGAGTWTLVSVGQNGSACVLATGRAWQQETLSRQGEPI